MKYLILALAVIQTIPVYACTWEAFVVDLDTDTIEEINISPYQATDFMIGGEQVYATCIASRYTIQHILQGSEPSMTVETGMIDCTYENSPGFPVRAVAARVQYSDGAVVNKPAVMTLGELARDDEKYIPKFEIRYQCTD